MLVDTAAQVSSCWSTVQGRSDLPDSEDRPGRWVASDRRVRRAPRAPRALRVPTDNWATPERPEVPVGSDRLVPTDHEVRSTSTRPFAAAKFFSGLGFVTLDAFRCT